jgi:hypothetical protein
MRIARVTIRLGCGAPVIFRDSPWANFSIRFAEDFDALWQRSFGRRHPGDSVGAGIDVVITSISAPGVRMGDDTAARDLAPRVNELPAELIQERPDRFADSRHCPCPVRCARWNTAWTFSSWTVGPLVVRFGAAADLAISAAASIYVPLSTSLRRRQK